MFGVTDHMASDPYKLSMVPRPPDDRSDCEIISVEDLKIAWKEKESEYRNRVLGDDSIVTNSGFVCVKKDAI